MSGMPSRDMDNLDTFENLVLDNLTAPKIS